MLAGSRDVASESRGSSVGIATGYAVGRPRGWVSCSGICQGFSLLRDVQTGSGVHPYPKGAVRGKTDLSAPTNIESNKTWIYTSTPPYVIIT
jgi:hypothetical protein